MNNIKIVETHKITSEEELKEYHKKYLEEGYEGSILRKGSGIYKINGRSSDLLKYKDFLDIDLPILDIIPCKIKSDWGEPIFSWSGAKGHRMGDNIMGAGTKLSHEQRKDLLINKHNYIGKIANVRYFEKSSNGVLRFPIMVGIHMDR